MSLELLEDGVIVSIMGMGMVFGFLIILVLAMNIMAVIMRYLNTKFPEAVPEMATVKRAAANDDSSVALAIAAVMNYKK